MKYFYFTRSERRALLGLCAFIFMSFLLSVNKADSIQSSLPIELNTMELNEVRKFTDVDKKLLKRVLKYRDALGGFHYQEQLLEVYGMDSMNYHQLIGQSILDPLYIDEIDLNNISFKALLKHPYFEYELVKELFQLKRKLDRPIVASDLRGVNLVNEELYCKIAPYLREYNVE